MKDADRFTLSLSNMDGRLSWRDLVNAPIPVRQPSRAKMQENYPTDLNPKIKGRPVYQLFDGEIVGEFDSIKQAAGITGLKKESISKVIRGLQTTTGGYQWIYA